MNACTLRVRAARMAGDLRSLPNTERTPDRASLALLGAGYRGRDIGRVLDLALQLASDPQGCRTTADGAEPEAHAA